MDAAIADETNRRLRAAALRKAASELIEAIERHLPEARRKERQEAATRVREALALAVFTVMRKR